MAHLTRDVTYVILPAYDKDGKKGLRGNNAVAGGGIHSVIIYDDDIVEDHYNYRG